MSDTHLPKRAKDLPAGLWAEVERVDLVIHAGDWVESSLLDDLERRSQQLLGVYGNNDFGDLRERLPEVAHARLEGVSVSVVHETGDKHKRAERCDQLFPNSDVLVFGHSHIPWDTTTPNGMRLLNPGSPTDRRRQPFCTYMTARIAGGVLVDVKLHELT